MPPLSTARWIRLLRHLNLLAAAVFAVLSISLWISQGLWGPLVLLLGLLIVGPFEDWLVQRISNLPALDEAGYEVVNQATSLLLIIAMIAASLMY